MNLIVRSVCSAEEKLGLVTWIERVPSQSNPADELSRAKMFEYAGVKAKEVNLMKCWMMCAEEASAKSSQVTGGETRDDI